MFIGVFLFTSTTYGLDIPTKSHLRIPLNKNQTNRRLNEVRTYLTLIELARVSVMPFQTGYLRKLLGDVNKLINQVQAATDKGDISNVGKLYVDIENICNIIIEMASDVMYHADAVDEHRVTVIVQATEFLNIAKRAMDSLDTPINKIKELPSSETRTRP